MQNDTSVPGGERPAVDAPLLGIGLAVAGAGLFVFQDAGVKWVIAELAVIQVLFLRSLFGLGILFAAAGAAGARFPLRPRRPWLMTLRTAINVLAWCFFFFGLKSLPLATATAIFFSFPLFLTALSRPILGDRVGPRRWAAIFVGFGGVLLMTKPGDGIDWPTLFMVGAALCWALTAIVTRVLGKTEETTTVLFYTLFGFLVTMALPQLWVWRSVDAVDLGLIGAIALFGVVAQFCLIKAYSIATPSIIAPFEYTGLVWAAILGFVVWGDVPDGFVVSGALLIVASGLYIIHREAGLFRRIPSR